MSSINKMLDELIDDFKYCLSDLLSIVEEDIIPTEKITQYKAIWEKYFG